MSSTTSPTSANLLDVQTPHSSHQKSDNSKVVSRGAVVLGAKDTNIDLNRLSSFEVTNDLIRDVDCTSSSGSSSSSGIVSSSTVGRDFDDITNCPDYLQHNHPASASCAETNDCLAYRRPWATPPTASTESSRLQIGGTGISGTDELCLP